MNKRAGIGVAPGGTGNRGGSQEAGAVIDADGFTASQGSGERAADRQGGVVGAGTGGNGTDHKADVVVDRGDRRRGGRGAEINAGGVGTAGGRLVASGVGNAGGIAQGLGISKAAAIAIAPTVARNRGGTQEADAVVDANGFIHRQGSGKRAADR